MIAKLPEIAITFTGFAILTLYHIHLIYKVRTSPMTTSIGQTNCLRCEWVKTVMENSRDILAVQTFRNWIMASSFLASAAIIIGLGVINASFSMEKTKTLAFSLNVFGTRSETMLLIKLLVLIIDSFFAFFNFTLSIRYYNHASFAINIPSSEYPEVTYTAVSDMINTGYIHYTMGMRGYYLAIPFTLWLFGPTWMLSGSIVLIIILYKLDRKV